MKYKRRSKKIKPKTNTKRNKKTKNNTIRTKNKNKISRNKYIQKGGIDAFNSIIERFKSGIITKELVIELVNFFITCANNNECDILSELKKARASLEENNNDNNPYKNDAINIIIAYETVIEYWAPIYDNINFIPFYISNCKTQLEQNNIHNFYKRPQYEDDYYCQIFSYFAFITELIKEDYTLLLKGGKSIQLLLNNSCPDYISDDIDMLIYSNKNPGDSQTEKDMAINISYLILWLSLKNNNYPLITLVNDKSHIVKISYRGERITALSDISYGYKNIDDKFKKFYLTDAIIHKPITLTSSSGNSIQGLFNYQQLKYLLYEKLYYLDKYVNDNTSDNSYFLNKSSQHLATLILCIYNDNTNTLIKELNANHSVELERDLREFYENTFKKFLSINKINTNNEKITQILKDCYRILAFLYIGFNNEISELNQIPQYKTKELILKNIYNILSNSKPNNLIHPGNYI